MFLKGFFDRFVHGPIVMVHSGAEEFEYVDGGIESVLDGF